MNSSQSRSRKRDSTNQSVDFLNFVQATPLPRSRRHNLKRKPFVPRSDDIFEVPSSPEKQRRPQTRGARSVPVTPQQPERPRISSLRERIARINYKESEGKNYAAHSRLDFDESEAGNKDHDRDSANSSEEEEEGGLLPAPVVFGQRFSNGNEDTEQNAEEYLGNSEDNALPNTGGVEQTADDGANNGEPNDDGIDQGATGNIGYEPDPLQQAAHEDESEDSPAQQLALNIQEQSGSMELAPIDNTPTQEPNLRSPTSTRKRKLEAVSGTGEAQPEPTPHQAADNESSEDSEEEESEEENEEAEEASEFKYEDSSDSEEEASPDSDTRPQKRPRTKSPAPQNFSVEIPLKRQGSPALAESDDESAGSPSQDSESSSSSSSSDEDESQHATPPRESPERSVIAESVVEDQQDVEPHQDGVEPRRGESSGEVPWFEQAQNLGQQKENWDTFMKHSNTLQRKADPSRIERFNDPNNLIVELHQTYGNMRKEPTMGGTISIEQVAGCENLLRGISNEGFRILDEVWSLSNKGREDLARKLLHGFETQVLPPMVGLIISCFLAYYVGQDRFPRSYSQLHGAMALLQSFCHRIDNQVKTGIVRGKMLSRKLNIALRTLITALECGAMSLTIHVPSRIRRKSGPFSYEGIFADDGSSDIDPPVPEKTWSDEEDKTLVRALQLYQGTYLLSYLPTSTYPLYPRRTKLILTGPDRYVQIIRHYGAHFPNRSTRELRSKARQVRDRFCSSAQGILATPEGRRQLEWLLTV